MAGRAASCFTALCTCDFLGCGEETRVPGGFLQTQHLLLWLPLPPSPSPLTLPFLRAAWTWPAQIRQTLGANLQEKRGQLRARGDAGHGILEDQLGKGALVCRVRFLCRKEPLGRCVSLETSRCSLEGGGTRGPPEDLTGLCPSGVAATGALSTLGWTGLTQDCGPLSPDASLQPVPSTESGGRILL